MTSGVRIRQDFSYPKLLAIQWSDNECFGSRVFIGSNLFGVDPGHRGKTITVLLSVQDCLASVTNQPLLLEPLSHPARVQPFVWYVLTAVKNALDDTVDEGSTGNKQTGIQQPGIGGGSAIHSSVVAEVL